MSNAKTPKAVAPTARRELEKVEMYLGDADRELEPLSKRELGAARARTSIWQALRSLTAIFNMRAENGDNGSNGHQE